MPPQRAGLLADFWELSLESGSCRDRSLTVPRELTPRAGHQAALVGDRMLVTGGRRVLHEGAGQSPEVWACDLAIEPWAWTRLTPPPTQPRPTAEGAAAVIVGSWARRWLAIALLATLRERANLEHDAALYVQALVRGCAARRGAACTRGARKTMSYQRDDAPGDASRRFVDPRYL